MTTVNETITTPELGNPVDNPIPLSRKSGKNDFSKYLRQVNTRLFQLGLPPTEHGTDDASGEVFPQSLSHSGKAKDIRERIIQELIYDRLILKLVPRELNKFIELLKYFAFDPYYDTVDRIVNFTRDDYVKRRAILCDKEMAFVPPLVRGRKKKGNVPVT